MGLVPLGDRVLVEPISEPTTTDSGIIIVRKWKDEETMGRVVFLADQRNAWCECEGAGTCLGCLIRSAVKAGYGTEGVEFLMRQVRRPRGFGVGDIVVFATSAGNKLLAEGQAYIVLREDDVLAKWEAQ